ncbi:UbiX family flavin prenyltransferase [Actinomyces glycerinitolerans]|uniref:Flavin prenyltransferase UbiX n=1 Tax=Actinomyces glycerinitolerans TaxID=1892869 RepID=A0A1M4RXW0_9ACTO|nr:UbiX family flavin prenyltransferase [Actinomyces glycerinitolerans]SHE24769.1 flavoprotein [Actinomyces glycerinitolerans]
MKRIIVGITGASGVQIGHRLLQALRARADVEVHLVITDGARLTLARETDLTVEQLVASADVVWDDHDQAAAISSGSFMTEGMVVAPCSMRSLSAIVNAYDDDLLVRAADVCAKEGRKVVLVPRETPLNRAHCRNLLRAAEDGYVLLPPMLTFYNGCETTADQVDHLVGRILMQFGIAYEGLRPWEG